MTNDAMTLTELLDSVRRVEVRTNRLVNDTMVGAYLSHFKGRGMDFEELREYIPGDDVRDIDWNVTHRLGRAVRETLPRGARTHRRARRGRLGVVQLRFGQTGPSANSPPKSPPRSPCPPPKTATRLRCCCSPMKWNCLSRRAKAAATSCASSAKCWCFNRATAARTFPARSDF